MSVVRQGMVSRRDPSSGNPMGMAVRFGGMGVLILVLLKFCNLSEFFSVQNWQSIAFEAVPIGLLGMGLALVMVVGAIDLSIAANFSLCVVVAGWLLTHGHSAAAAIVGAGLAGVICGAINGTLIGVLGLPSVTVTLGSLAMISGLAFAISDGQIMAVNFFPDLFTGGFGIFLVILIVLLAGALWFVLSTGSLGALISDPSRQPRAGNSQDAMVRPELISLFCGAGLLAALAALIEIGQQLAADPNSGSSFLITAITAAAVGGVGFFRGGPLAIPGAALGAVLISIVNTELILADVSYGWVQFTLGAIIAASLLIDRLLEFTVVT
jgi:ribose/xylose/arabinose/galactoside ABC-type transport system permease subunit